MKMAEKEYFRYIIIFYIIIIIILMFFNCDRKVAAQMSIWPVLVAYMDWMGRSGQMERVVTIPFQVRPQPMSPNLKARLGNG